MTFDAQHTPYEALGGETPLRSLVTTFYDEMDRNDDFGLVRALHADDLADAREKLFEFLSGWLGGPPLYVEKHGHPKLRARHQPFPIGELERDQWLSCMAIALDECGIQGELRAFLDERFAHVADFMRNAEQPR